MSEETRRKRKLTPEELAIGEQLINSKKHKAKLIDDSFNRYATFDAPDALPDWFREDEEAHAKKTIPVSREALDEYKKKFDEINSRPIKKVVESQVRKKRKLSKKLDIARKKADGVSDNVEMTDKERSSTIKSIYKKAGLLGKKKPEIKYLTAKRGQRGSVVAKAAGVKGPYRVVDRRLKKDKRPARNAAYVQSKAGSKKGKKKNPPLSVKPRQKPVSKSMGGGGKKKNRR